MTTAEPLSPGQQALLEAARREAACVYGRVVPEHKNDPLGLAALIAEAELTPVDKSPAQPVEDE